MKREVVSSDTLEMDVEENLQTLADDDPGERTPGHGEHKRDVSGFKRGRVRRRGETPHCWFSA